MKKIIAALCAALMLAVSPASAAGTRPAPSGGTLNNTSGVGTVATSAGVLNMVVSSSTTINGTSTTADILLFRSAAGATLSANGVAGVLCINVQDTATGANAYAACMSITATGLGATSAAFNVIGSATVRGTSPVGTIALAADGGSGAVKVRLTTPATGVSGANVVVSFIGAVRP